MLAFLLAFLFVCGFATVIEARFRVVQRGYDHFVLDNRNHYLPCTGLPAEADVDRIVAQHADTIRQIQNVAPGSVGVEIDSSTCEGRADLLIWYGTHQQRIAIERIIHGETLFGIPYRLENR
jgi:hypothetical protein